jgi:hypothetical protein
MVDTYIGDPNGSSCSTRHEPYINEILCMFDE